MWIRNTSGKPDAALTLLSVFFLAFVLRFLLGGLTFGPLGTLPIMGTTEAAAAVLSLLGLEAGYLARRNGWGNAAASSAVDRAGLAREIAEEVAKVAEEAEG